MVQLVWHKAVLVIGVAAIGVLAVACAGTPQMTTLPNGFQASVGGFTVNVAPPTIPFVTQAQPANSQGTTKATSELQGAVHSGEGCPLALPQ